MPCPIKNTQKKVYYSQEALPDVNHALKERDLRRPKIKNGCFA
jgi:hypothetical protein